MLWLVLSLVAAMVFSATQILDSFLITRIFKQHVFSSSFYVHMSKALILLLVFLIFVRDLFPLKILPALCLIAVAEILFLILYFKALEIEDTSVVSALFSLGKVFIPILAFFAIGEVLTTNQYFGFFLIILSGAVLSLRRRREGYHLNPSFFYMALATSLLAVQGVAYKYVFMHTTWLVGYTWAFLFMGVSTLTLLLIRVPREQITADVRKCVVHWPAVVGNAVLSVIAWGCVTLAISLTEVSLVKGVLSSEPFFVLFYALLFGRFFPTLFRERVDKRTILKKSVLFVVLAVGVLLMVL